MTLIVAALIRRGDSLLLVRQQGPDHPAAVWALPGGVVEAGELLSETLAREVREETGLELRDPGRLVCVAQLHSPSSHPHPQGELPVPGDRATALVFEPIDPGGVILEAGPDELVPEARFWSLEEAIGELDRLPWRFMREPVITYLRGEAERGTVWLYRRQPDGSDQLVARLPASAEPVAESAVGRARGASGETNNGAGQALQPSLQRTVVVLGCMAFVLVFALLIVVGLITVFQVGLATELPG